MKYPVMNCPLCDTPLTAIWWEKDDTWEYNEERGIYEERDSSDDTREVKCAKCQGEITDYIGDPNNFHMSDEITDRNGVQRRCEYCMHFVPDHDITDPDYNPDIAGHCNEGGGWDEVGDATRPLTKMDCNAFKLCSILHKELATLSNPKGSLDTDIDGVIIDAK